MLKAVEITGFKSCRQLRLVRLSPVTLLVGPNGVGKSNILQAISWAAASAVADSVPRLALDATGGGPVAFRLKFTTEKKRTYEYHWSTATGNGRPAGMPVESLRLTGGSGQTLFTREGPVLRAGATKLNIAISSSALSAALAFLPAEHPAHAGLSDAASYLRRIRYYSFEDAAASDAFAEREAFIPAGKYEQWAEDGLAAGNPGASAVYKIIHMWLTKDERLEELAHLLGLNGLRIFEDITVEKMSTPRSGEGEPGGLYFVRFKEPGRPVAFAFDQISAGKRRIVNILAAMIFDGSSVLLVEQPEDNIHPDLMYKLISLMRTYSVEMQFIMSSHSPTVVNGVEPTGLRMVAMTRGRTNVRSLSAKELGWAGRFLKETGSLSEFVASLAEG